MSLLPQPVKETLTARCSKTSCFRGAPRQRALSRGDPQLKEGQGEHRGR